MKKLLVIDDEEDIIQEVKLFFEDEGFQVAVADTGRKGLDLFDSGDFDLILLDLKLPDISGLEVLKEMKASNKKSKVIVNTGYIDFTVKENAKKLGCDSFLSKPFNLIRLQEEVEKVLNSEICP